MSREATAQPWLTDPRFGGMSPTAARASWDAEQRRPVLHVVEPEPEPEGEEAPPPVEGPADYGLPADPDEKSAIQIRVPDGPVKSLVAYRPELLDDIELSDDPSELIEGLLPLGPGFGLVFGPPKSLKSFLLTHVGMVIAADQKFCGRKVQAGAVIYVTSEGIRGVRRRLIASRRALGIEGSRAPFFLVSTMPNLGAGPDDRGLLESAIRSELSSRGITNVRLIIVDTFRRAMPGKSENEQKDVSIVIDNCEAIARTFNCLVLAVHHSPRSDESRGSGSNATDASADVMWGVSREDGTTRATASVVRYKDGEEGDAWTFELRPVEIGVDTAGCAISSCYVEVVQEPARASAPQKTSALTAAQQRVFDIVVDAVNTHGEAGLAGEAAPRGMRAVTRDALIQHAKSAGWWNTDNEKSSRENLRSRLNEIAGKHAVGLTATHAWVARRSSWQQ